MAINNIRIVGDNLPLTDTLKQYIFDKLGKLDDHFQKITDIHVILKTIKDGKRKYEAEAQVIIPNKRFFADSRKENMYEAIDILYSKLDPQIQKYKGKIKARNVPPSNL